MFPHPQGRFVHQSASFASTRLASLAVAEEKLPSVAKICLNRASPGGIVLVCAGKGADLSGSLSGTQDADL
jgi:hypothetical protein